MNGETDPWRFLGDPRDSHHRRGLCRCREDDLLTTSRHTHPGHLHRQGHPDDAPGRKALHRDGDERSRQGIGEVPQTGPSPGIRLSTGLHRGQPRLSSGHHRRSPVGREFRSPGWKTTTGELAAAFGHKTTLIWVAANSPTMKHRITTRGAPRDRGKLKDWISYSASLNLTTPNTADITIANSAGAVPLEEQADEVARRLGLLDHLKTTERPRLLLGRSDRGGAINSRCTPRTTRPCSRRYHGWPRTRPDQRLRG